MTSLKVLQVMGCTSDQYGSMERYLVAKAQALRNRGGHLVVVYENTPQSDRFIRELVDAGGELRQMRMRGRFDGAYLHKTRNLIMKENVGLVHLYFGPTSHALSIYLGLRGYRHLVRTAPNLPSAFRRPGQKMHGRLGRYLALRHRFLARLVRKIICRSEAVLRDYAALGVPSQKLAVVCGGADAATYRFSPESRSKIRAELGIPNGTFVIGAFSRLVKVKNIDRLIRGFQGLSDGSRDCRLVVSGDGPEKDALMGKAASLSLADSVIFLGNREDVAGLYSALDVFCSASLAEGMSNSILEAMSSGLPVVASDIPPNRELIDDGEGGYLVDFGRPDEFRRRVELLWNPEVRKKMGAYNRKKIIRQFSLEARVEKELEVYAEVLS